jgi:signal transduction histidine kinase
MNSYFEKSKLETLSFICYSVLCIFAGDFILFLPLIFYDVIIGKKRWLYLIIFVPLLSNVLFLSNKVLFITMAFLSLSTLLKLRTLKVIKLKDEYIKFRDTSSEISMLLEEKNTALLENQDHEVNVATLSERNRIAREIHDNLGHILSRSLLQIGALITINKDPVIKEMLISMKDTLSQGMDSVRKSIHNLHEESIDLQDQIYSLVKDFTFCPIKLTYDISEKPDKKLKYAFITIVKETLSNIIKHSNATEVCITIKEHPGIYQLIIQDNGTNINYDQDNGIGIKNITDRVALFKGIVNIDTQHGFKIFISIPKESLK